MLLLILNPSLLPKNASAQSLERFLEWNEAGDTFKNFGGPGAPIIIHTGAIGYTNCFEVPNGVRDGFFRSADIYIIYSRSHYGLPNLPIGSQLNDVGGVPNTITSAAAGGLFIEELIGFTGNLIGEGMYSIVYDECQDGKLGPEDKVFDNAFKVELADNVPHIPSSYMHSVKADAAREAKFWTETSNLFKYGMKAIDLVKYSTKLLQCLGNIKNMLTNKQCGLLTLVEIGNKEVLKKTDFWSIVDVKKIVQIHLLNTIKKWAAIEADPADLNFKNFSPINITDTIKVDLKEPIRSSYAKLGNSLSINNAILDSILHSLEKYQGATYNNNGEWALIHAKKIKDYSLLLVNELPKTNSILTSLGNEFRDRSNVIDNVSSFIRNTQEQLKTTGFTSNDTKFLLNLGLNSDQIMELKDIILAEDTFESSQITNITQNLISLNLKTSNDLIALSNQMDSIISSLEANDEIFKLVPTANAGGPYITNTNEQVVLNGSESFAPSVPEGRNIIKWEWDLNGDLIYGDVSGKTPNVSFNESFDGFLGLKVTDSTGLSDISFTKLIVIDNNNPPSINSLSPLTISGDINLGTSIHFFVNALDHDNDQLNFNWYLNDTLLSSGTNNLTFVPNSLGFKTISVEISDNNNGIDSESWSFYVVPEDADNDNWNGNIDCNDNNPNINPGIKEIYYNGIDDDCNPSTLDNNSPPIAKSIKMATYQNTIATIDLTATDIDKDLLSFSIVDRPENGTLRNLKVFPFSNSAVVEYVPNTKFHGTDSFTFIASDSNAKSNVAKVDINIGILETPVAQFQEITINEDTPTEIELRGTSPDGHALDFFLESRSITRVAGQPTVGTIKDFRITGPYTANLTYIPPPDFSSNLFGFGDRFHFRVSDGNPVPGFPRFESSSASVEITVNNINDPPEPFNKIVSTVKETPVDISLRSFDMDNDQKQRSAKVNKNLTFGIYSPPSHGTLGKIVTNHLSSPIPSFSLTKDVVTYFPNNGFTGEDSFRFFASDGISQGIGNVTIKVKPTNSISPEFEDGDIIFSTLGTGIHWYKSDGTFVKKLPSAPATAFGNVINVGGAFDSLGNLYVAEFNSLPVYNGTGVSKYNKNGELIDVWRENFGCLERGSFNNGTRCLLPESITIDKDDNVFVGGVATAEGGTLNNEVQNKDERDDIRKFDSNGTFITRFNPSVEKRGSDWVELDPNQCTLYYTSEGRHVKQYDVCNDVQMKDFGDVYGIGRSGEDQGSRSGNFPNYALRLLPDGDLLVASESKIVKLDSTGNIIQTYDIPNEDPLFALNLDPDGKSFWTTSIVSHDIYRIDIESGKVLQHFTTSLDGPVMGGISGIIIKGEPTLSTAVFPPTVFNQTIFINDNRPLTINLTAFDISNDPLTFAIINNPLHGQLSQLMQISNNMSSLVYTPDPNFDGEDSFTFNANDGSLESNNTGTITIRTNHPPIANSDFANTSEGLPVNIPILANDTDIDPNDAISITSVNSSQTLGNITINRHNSTITYFPFESFSGIDSFNYTISDSHNATSQAEVTVNIQSLNSFPVANPQTVTIVENTPINITLTGSDSDLNDDLLFLRGAGPQNGFLDNFNRTTGQVQYTPLHNFDGIDTFSFRVFDGKVASEPSNVTISILEDGINDPPVVESERISANVGQPISVNVLENDIDLNGDFLTLTNITGPFNGTAILNQDQTITYHSDLNFNSSDVLYYRVADPSGDFDIGQLIIDVQGNADTQNIQVPSDRLVTTTRDQPIDIELIATATIDRPVAFFIIDAPNNGTLGNITTLSNLSASVNYTPNTSFVGEDSFTYVAIDDQGVVSNIGVIRVSVDEIPRNPPIARDSQVMLDEDTSIPIQLDASDSDVNDDLTYSIVSQPISGKIISFDSSTGSLVYKPNANFNGNDEFLFKAVDQDRLESNIATVLITVSPVNDPPVANNHQLETDQNTPLQITLSGADPIDNDTISQFRIANSPTNGQISNFNANTGTLTYTPNNNFAGQDSFTFKVTDSHGLESINTGIITISVKSTQEPPNNEQPPLPLPSSVCRDANNDVKAKGTQGNDELIGTSQRDTITGLGGNDRFNGCSGDDTLNGNSGNDGIAGGPGNDKLHGNEGNDYLQGDSGDDSLFGNEGNDMLVGNEGRDEFSCGSGHDKILDFNNQLDTKSNDCEEF